MLGQPANIELGHVGQAIKNLGTVYPPSPEARQRWGEQAKARIEEMRGKLGIDQPRTTPVGQADMDRFADCVEALAVVMLDAKLYTWISAFDMKAAQQIERAFRATVRESHIAKGPKSINDLT